MEQIDKKVILKYLNTEVVGGKLFALCSCDKIVNISNGRNGDPIYGEYCESCNKFRCWKCIIDVGYSELPKYYCNSCVPARIKCSNCGILTYELKMSKRVCCDQIECDNCINNIRCGCIKCQYCNRFNCTNSKCKEIKELQDKIKLLIKSVEK